MTTGCRIIPKVYISVIYSLAQFEADSSFAGPFDQHIEDQSPQSITQPSAEGEDDAQATLLADQQAAATLPPGMNSMVC